MFLFIWPGYFLSNMFYAKIFCYLLIYVIFCNFKFGLTNVVCLLLNYKASPVNVHTRKLCSYLSVQECIFIYGNYDEKIKELVN